MQSVTASLFFCLKPPSPSIWITTVAMRPGSLLPLLAFGPLAQAAAAVSEESRSLFARDFELLTTRDLEQLSPREVEALTTALVERGLLDDIWQKVKDATTCAGGEVSWPTTYMCTTVYADLVCRRSLVHSKFSHFSAMEPLSR